MSLADSYFDELEFLLNCARACARFSGPALEISPDGPGIEFTDRQVVNEIIGHLMVGDRVGVVKLCCARAMQIAEWFDGFGACRDNDIRSARRNLKEFTYKAIDNSPVYEKYRTLIRKEPPLADLVAVMTVTILEFALDPKNGVTRILPIAPDPNWLDDPPIGGYPNGV